MIELLQAQVKFLKQVANLSSNISVDNLGRFLLDSGDLLDPDTACMLAAKYIHPTLIRIRGHRRELL